MLSIRSTGFVSASSSRLLTSSRTTLAFARGSKALRGQGALHGLSRAYSSGRVPKQGSSFRVSTVFYALVGVGLAATVYGVYDFYGLLTMWPEEVRADLLPGIKAKHQGDLALSERYLKRAYDNALSLPIDTFSPSPYLKISALAITLSEVMEANDRPKYAYEVYTSSITHFQSNWSALDERERLRAVAIAHKLGEMADTYQLGEEEEERWLTWAVEEALRIAKAAHAAKGKGKEESNDETVVLAELDLPKWVSVADIGAPIEALGAFYARTGKLEYAVPLYLQAISLLVPPMNSGKSASPEELCRGAQLMSNLSDLFMRGARTTATLHQAEAWARQALSLIEKTRSKSGNGIDICEQAFAVTLFNLGSIREARDDPVAAGDLFRRSLEQSNKIGMREGIAEARQAIRRVDRMKRAAQTAWSSAESDTK
ncbi:hypothetical protein BV25DRAFT_1795961 [Artomyces pyxidatus]|uniref:Uncharacterized protein n=1 Tax=Artomyces pyxidatus TaxID=48021 RepID=A0ACB8TEI7_9AGAM|nr:hypothetical protein BV25DRAFT_1795961 [Artomyces pyxidatus]